MSCECCAMTIASTPTFIAVVTAVSIVSCIVIVFWVSIIRMVTNRNAELSRAPTPSVTASRVRLDMPQGSTQNLTYEAEEEALPYDDGNKNAEGIKRPLNIAA